VAGFEDEDDDEDEYEAPCEADDKKGKGMKYRGPKKGKRSERIHCSLGLLCRASLSLPRAQKEAGFIRIF
jgi:hypothetical protein